MKVLLSQRGESDLLAIAERLGGTQMGTRFVDQFDRALERLALFPASGKRDDRLGAIGSFLVLGEFVLTYEVRADSIWIVSIVDSAIWREND